MIHQTNWEVEKGREKKGDKRLREGEGGRKGGLK